MLHNEARKPLTAATEKTRKVQEVVDCYLANRSTIYRLKKRWEETSSFETRTFLRKQKLDLSPPMHKVKAERLTPRRFPNRGIRRFYHLSNWPEGCTIRLPQAAQP